MRIQQINVTLTTNVPQTDIFIGSRGLKARRMGKTDAGGKLNLKLAYGSYEVTAARPGYGFYRQQINVRPGSTAFGLNLTAQGGAPGVAASGAVGGALVAEATGAGTAEDVMRRYLDPQQSERVTLADWQLVQRQRAAAFAADPLNSQAQAQALFAEGQIFHLRSRYADAVASFNHAALALPDSALAFYGLGNAYLATKQTSQAIRAYQRAIELNGNMALPQLGMYEALMTQGKKGEARKYLNRARELGSTSAKMDMNAARDLMSRERWSEALKELQGMAQTQKSAPLFISIGDCYVGLKQSLSAAQAYRRATEIDPKSATAHVKLGELLMSEREYASARESFERALQLDATGAIINRAQVVKLSAQAAARMR